MGINEIFAIDIHDATVLIIGHAASGKTWLSKEIASENERHQVVNLDEYIKYGEEALDFFITDATMWQTSMIIEGILGYKLLKDGRFFPNIVIECEMPKYIREKIYLKERPGKILKHVKYQDMANTSILNQYFLETPEYQRPRWYVFNNPHNATKIANNQF